MKNNQKFLMQLKNQIYLERPVLKEIMQAHGREFLYDYIKKNWHIPTKEPDLFFLKCLQRALVPVYGQALTKQVVIQLKTKPIISTVDHHGIWNHPIFVNSALIYSLFFKKTELAIVLSTESVSLNNSSSWSGCLMFHNNFGEMERHSFFPDKLKTLPVFSTPAIKKGDLKKILQTMPSKLAQTVELLNNKKIFRLPDFSMQACLISFLFWQKAFPSAPKLVYFPLERAVNEYLTKIFTKPDHFFSQLILTKKGQGLWKKYFSKESTFLFWGLNEKNKRVPLTEIPLNQKKITNLINEKKMYPSSPLCFAVLLYSGIACAGGFTQTTWLTKVKKKLSSFYSDLTGSLNNPWKNVETKNFSESFLAWFKAGQNPIMPTALDLMSSDKNYYLIYKSFSKKITLNESFDFATPFIYKVLFPEHTRQQKSRLKKLQNRLFFKLKTKLFSASKNVNLNL